MRSHAQFIMTASGTAGYGEELAQFGDMSSLGAFVGKTITLEPNEAFGPKLDDLIMDLPKEGFEADANLTAGSRVTMNSPKGKKFTGTILEVKDENIKVDFNHPLAGNNLIFTVTVVSIV